MKGTYTHRKLGAGVDQDFDLRRTSPVPWVQAMEALALHDGVCAESLSLAFDANLGFMEHHATRLLHASESTHKGVSPAPSAMLASAVSSKKSHLVDYTDGFLAQSEPLDDEGKPGYIAQRAIVLSDGTLAGIRKSLVNYNRAIITSSEASNTYERPFSTKRPGVHFLIEQIMNKFTQSECDDAATGCGVAHIGSERHPYLILHKVSGQQEVVESILKPVAHGFQKRFWVAFAPRGLPHDESQPIAAAQELVHGLHKWMFDRAFYEEPAEKHVLDGYARTLYDAAKKAVEDVKAEHEMSTFMVAKLDFCHSDLLRSSHLAMRKCQYLASLSSSAPGHEEALRTKPNVYEFAMALHLWRRQVSLHFGYYRWMAGVGPRILADVAAGLVGGSELLHGEGLAGEDYFKNKVLMDMPTEGCFDTNMVRMKFRGAKRTKDLAKADTIKKICEELVQSGLLLDQNKKEDPAAAPKPKQRQRRRGRAAPVSPEAAQGELDALEPEAAVRKKGHKVYRYKKRPLSEIQSDGRAEEALCAAQSVPLRMLKVGATSSRC